MLSVRAGQVLLLAATLAITPAIASRIHRPPTSGHSRGSSAKSSPRKHRRVRVHGQRTIDSGRATQIQEALIQQKYLTGAPSGRWDARTEAAMQRYQADHGWQTKLMPDSRALISLGLGPAGSNPDAVVAGATLPASSTAPPQPADEPAANTLASVHAITQ